MKYIWIIILLLTTTTLEAAEWPKFLGNNLSTSKSTETLEPPLTVKWTYQTDEKIISSASIKNGKVYFGSRDNTFNVLNETDGSLIWKYTANDWIDSSAYVDDDNVYFSSKDGHIYKLKSEDGSLQWKFDTEGTNSSSPIVDESVVIVGTGFPKKEILALDASSGIKLWSKETNQMVYSSASISGNSIYIGSNDGFLYNLNKNNGSIKWKFKTKGGIYYATPSLNNDTVYLAPGNSDWKMYALNAEDGSLIWEFLPSDAEESPTYVSSVSIGNDELYFVSGYNEQKLYCINANNGSLKWKANLGPATRYGFSSTPIATDSTVYVATSGGKLKAFEVGTGNLTWEHDFNASVLASPVIANGTLYLGTFDGNLYAFN